MNKICEICFIYDWTITDVNINIINWASDNGWGYNEDKNKKKKGLGLFDVNVYNIILKPTNIGSKGNSLQVCIT